MSIFVEAGRPLGTVSQSGTLDFGIGGGFGDPQMLMVALNADARLQLDIGGGHATLSPLAFRVALSR